MDTDKNEDSRSGTMDCHATAGAAARNDKNLDSSNEIQNLNDSTKDSRINKNAQNVFSQNAARRQDFAIFDKNTTTLSDLAQDSRISKETSLRLFSKETSPNGERCPLFSKETAFCDDYALNDSKNCGGAVVALRDFEGRSYLSGNDYPQNHAINPHCSPKTESPQAQIPLIDLHPQYHAYKPELDSAIASVLHSQHFILGKHSKALESELASFVGRRFCITCSSGTSALLLALLALEIGEGDEVITPSFSFIAAAEMVAFLGAKPVFVDICPSTYTLDPAQVARAISPRTKAIIPVSLFGQPYDVGAIAEVAGAIPIIEDGAQSFGSKILGEREARSGSFGTLSITSFFPSKPLGGYGDGGAVFCDDEKLAQRLRTLRNHGQTSKYHHQSLGLNARLDELQCAILRVKLRHLPKELNLREQVAARYYALLKPLQSHLALPYIAPNRTSVFAQFCLRVKEPSPTQPTHKPHATLQNADSRISTQTAQNLNDSQAAGFCDDYALNDSKNCGGALRALGQFGGGSYLSGNDYPQIDPIASNCSPKAESPQAQKVDSKPAHRRQDFAIFDKNSTNLSDLAQDSSPKAQSPQAQKVDSSTAATLNKQPKDSRISRLESGFFEPRKDNKTRGLLTQRGDEIHDSSPKAKSSNQTQHIKTPRDHIISTLNAHGIATAIHYPTPLHLQECFAYLGYKKGDFPVSEQIAKEIFSIPFSPYLTAKAQEHIASSLTSSLCAFKLP